jgi:transposase
MKLELSQEDRQALLEVKRHGRQWRERERAEALLLLAQVGSSHEVAKQLGTSERTIRRCCGRWHRGGAAALTEGHRSGRHPLLGPEQVTWLCEEAARRPQTAGQLQAALKAEFPRAPAVSQDTIKARLRGAGYRWKRTRYGLKKSAMRPPSPPQSSA